MTPRKLKTRGVPRDCYIVYLKKAREFFNTMQASMSKGEWNAAGLGAVHCAISSADALLVYNAGVRSAGESHHDAAGLLERHIKDERIGRMVQNFTKIVSYKTPIEYEEREFTEEEAADIAKLTQRFFEWVQSLLP